MPKRGSAYVAGRFTKKEDVRRMQAALVELGFEITFDWTQSDAGDREGPMLQAYMAEQALLDYKGVKYADLVVVLHDDTGKGLFTEFGIALNEGCDIVVVGSPPTAHGNVFYWLPRIRHVRDQAGAVEYARHAYWPWKKLGDT